MSMKLLNLSGLTRVCNWVKAQLATKQDKLSGSSGQLVGFTGDNAVGAVDVPETTYVIEQNIDAQQKFWRGTKSEFDALAERSEDVMYLVTDDEIDGTNVKEYIDTLVGDIDAVLDAVNGEVPV